MYYHTVVLHLFRPFLKVDLTNSKVSPRDVCTSCANTISTLLSTYRRLYGFRCSSVVATHIILSSNIIDLINLPDTTAARNLELGVKCLRESSVNHAFAVRCLHILLALSKQWRIQLPVEVSRAAYELPPEMLTNYIDSPDPVSVWPPTPPSSLTYSHQQDYRKSSVGEMPYYATSDNPRLYSQNPQITDLFWSPFSEHGVPLQAMETNGPMDISTVIDVDTNWWDQLNRDGFKMVNMDDPLLGPSNYMLNEQWSHG